MAYGGDISTLNDRQPTLEDFRLQLYVYLCYGARGISHFCYQSPFSGEFGPHQTGLWYNGRKTERWAIARKVNREILSFSSEYLKLSWNGCIKISGNDNDIFKKLYHYDFTKCRFIKDISTDDDILVGVFSDNDGREGYVIVNYSETSQRKCVNLDIVLNKEAKITLYKNSKRKTKRVKEGFALTLKSGEGVFMTLSD